MSGKLKLQSLVKNYVKAKKEAQKVVKTAIQTVQQIRQDQEGTQNRPS